MGGHALKNTPVSRIDLNTLTEVKAAVKEILLPYAEVDFPIERPGKKDFGDIDVLYKPTQSFKMMELAQSLFKPKEMVQNGIVISFAYHHYQRDEYIQVDLILVEDMQMSKFFYSFGDCGNLLGAVTHHYGLKFGFQGLFLIPTMETITCFLGSSQFASNVTVTDKIILSTDPNEICNYLKMSFEQWLQCESGCTEDIFAWIRSCRLYHGSIFSSINRNHRLKVNDRPMYRDFVTSIDAEVVEKAAALDQSSSSASLQLEAIRHFHKEQELSDIIEKVRRFERRRKLFNASLFLSHGLTSGPALGEAMAGFKQYIIARRMREQSQNCEVELEGQQQQQSQLFDVWLDSIEEGKESEVTEEVDLYLLNKLKD